MRKDELDFQKFYYTKVGLGEGCGCAERVIDIHEADRKASMPLRINKPQSLRQSFRQLRNALGLTHRNPG